VSEDIRRFFEHMAEEARRPEPGVPPRMLRRAARRRVRTVLVIGLVGALLGYGGFVGVHAIGRPAPQVPAAPHECSTWTVVPSPNQEPERLDNSLDAVAAFSDDDVWAVGVSYVNQEGGENLPLAMHWDGASWTIVAVSDSLGLEGLLDVDGASPDDVWAVGLGHDALHWDGSRWSTVPLADPGTTYWHVEALSAAAPDDVWAVGNWATGDSGGPLVEYWDGSRWSVVESPSPSPENLNGKSYWSLSAVDALGPADAWATGQTENVAPAGESNTIALHWDGSTWTRTPTPDARAQNGAYGHLFGVSALASDNVWAVGLAGSEPGYFGGGDRALIQHWNGSSWAVSETLPADSRFVDVLAVSPNEVWAVGSTGAMGGRFSALVQRWDGTRWEEVPTGVTGQVWLSGVSQSPSGGLWAVGLTEDNGHARTLSLRCAGG
jgi:hypothetical protein